MNAAPFDSDLLRRYDVRAPRYTSYPTAPHFHNGFDAMAYRRAALLSNESPAKPLSAYVRVPFCANPCFYCGCNKIITRDPQRALDYVRRLLREIEMKGVLFDRSRVLRQLHVGGGTPTFLKIGMSSISWNGSQRVIFMNSSRRDAWCARIASAVFAFRRAGTMRGRP